MEVPDTANLLAEQEAHYWADTTEMDRAVRATLAGHRDTEYDIALRPAAAEAPKVSKRQRCLRHHLDVPGLPADEHDHPSPMPICEEEH